MISGEPPQQILLLTFARPVLGLAGLANLKDFRDFNVAGLEPCEAYLLGLLIMIPPYILLLKEVSCINPKAPPDKAVEASENFRVQPHLKPKPCSLNPKPCIQHIETTPQ